MSHDQTTDHVEWIARLRGSDEERNSAVRELSDLLIRGLSKSLGGRLGGGLLAEDIVQEAMIKILDSLDSFEGRSQFTTWALTIANRVGISELRRKRYRDVSINARDDSDQLSIDVAIDESGGGQSMDRHALLVRLQQLIETALTDKQRLALQAHLEGLPIEQIAERTGSNRNAVYKLVHDARLRLRAGFEQAGITADDVTAILA